MLSQRYQANYLFFTLQHFQQAKSLCGSRLGLRQKLLQASTVVFMRYLSLLCSKIAIMLLAIYIDLYYMSCIVYIHHRIVGRHLVTVSNQLYTGKNYFQACDCSIYEESIFVYIKFTDALLLLYVLICILLVALLEPTIIY